MLKKIFEARNGNNPCLKVHLSHHQRSASLFVTSKLVSVVVPVVVPMLLNNHFDICQRPSARNGGLWVCSEVPGRRTKDGPGRVPLSSWECPLHRLHWRVPWLSSTGGLWIPQDTQSKHHIFCTKSQMMWLVYENLTQEYIYIYMLLSVFKNGVSRPLDYPLQRFFDMELKEEATAYATPGSTRLERSALTHRREQTEKCREFCWSCWTRWMLAKNHEKIADSCGWDDG